jgi:signal transduction histidine kinase
MALAREFPQVWPVQGRPRPSSRTLPPPADGRRNVTTDSARRLEVVESTNLDEARLDGVRLAAREMAHLLNNDLAVAVGLVELLQGRTDMPPRLRELLSDAAESLEAAAQHIDDFQDVVRVAVKDTPAGLSLDLERSRDA